MENRTNIDIQERTFKFGVRIIKFVDKLPRTLSATELGKQLHSAQSPLNAHQSQTLIIDHC